MAARATKPSMYLALDEELRKVKEMERCVLCTEFCEIGTPCHYMGGIAHGEEESRRGVQHPEKDLNTN